MYTRRILLFITILTASGLFVSLSAPDKLWAASICKAADATKNKAEKIAAYTHCLEEKSGDRKAIGEILYKRGDSYRRTKKYNEARKDYRKALGFGVSVGKIEQRLGWMAYYEKDYPRSISHYQKALEANPKDSWSLRDMADSTCRITGQYEQALTQYNEAVSLNPQKQSKILYSKGLCQRRHDKYEAAIQSFSTAIFNGPSSVPPARFAAFNGDWEIAGDDPRSKKSKFSDTKQLANIYKYRGLSFAKLGDYKNAYLDIYQAKTLNSSSSSIENSLAWLLATCPDGRIRNGKRAIEYAINVTKRNSSTSYRDTLAAAYAEAGQFKQAVATQQQVINALKEKGETDLKQYEDRLRQYQQNIPYREYSPYDKVPAQSATAHLEPPLESYYMPNGESSPQHWEWLIDHQYEMVGAGKYRVDGELGFNQAGYAQAYDENGYWGIIDRQGKFIYRSEESRYAPSAGDLNIVRKASRGKVEYVDFRGHRVIDGDYFWGGDFFKSNNGVTWVTDNKESYKTRGTERLINIAGETLMTMDQATESHGTLSEGFTALTSENRCGYYNSAGKAITPRKYVECRPFANGFGQVKKEDGSIALISVTGQEVRNEQLKQAANQWGFTLDDLFGHDRRKKQANYNKRQKTVDIDVFRDFFPSFGLKSVCNAKRIYDTQGNLYLGKQFGSAPVDYFNAPVPDKLTSVKELRILKVENQPKLQPRLEGVIDIYGRVLIPAQFEKVVGFSQLKNEVGEDDLIVVIRHNKKYGFIRLLNNFKKAPTNSLALTLPKFNPNPKEPASYPALSFGLLQQAEHDYLIWKDNKDPERFQRALFNIESALVIEPEKSELWFFKGLLLSELKASPESTQQALTAFLHTVALNPEHGRGQVMLAQSLFNNGLFDNTIDQIKFLFAKDRNLMTPQLTSLLASSYIAAGRTKEGEQFFLAESLYHPESVAIKIALAVLFHDQGQTANAIKSLQPVINAEDVSPELKSYAANLGEKWQQEGK